MEITKQEEEDSNKKWTTEDWRKALTKIVKIREVPNILELEISLRAKIIHNLGIKARIIRTGREIMTEEITMLSSTPTEWTTHNLRV
jgi:hypothetical protein